MRTNKKTGETKNDVFYFVEVENRGWCYYYSVIVIDYRVNQKFGCAFIVSVEDNRYSRVNIRAYYCEHNVYKIWKNIKTISPDTYEYARAQGWIS